MRRTKNKEDFTMNIKAVAFLFTLLLLVSSCKDHSQPSAPISGTLSGSRWQLVQIDNTTGGSIVLEEADTIILTFDDVRRLSGESPGRCGNTYFGVYSIPAAHALRTDSLSTTEIYCAQSQYHDYYSLLIRAEHYQQYEARLEVLCDNQSRRLVLKRVH